MPEPSRRQARLRPSVPIRVAILSRRPLFLGLIASWLRGLADVEVALEASEGDVVGVTDIDLVILDARDATSFSAAEAALAGKSAGAKVLVVAAGKGDYVQQRASAMATGAVHEHDDLEVLRAAITTVAAGGVYFSATVLQRQGAMPLKALTARELAILEHACAGRSDDDAAKLLGCSSSTVETHRRNAMRKMGAADWAELVILGLKLGIVSPEGFPIGSRCRRSSSRRKSS